MKTRRFVSVNIRSLCMYLFAIGISTLIVYSILTSDPYQLIIFGIVIVWIPVAFYFILFSRCRFTDEEIIISGDFVFEKDQRIQKSHVISYADINSCQLENLTQGFDTNHEALNLKQRSRKEYRFFYGYDKIECLTFNMNDGSKKSLIVNRYSQRQIKEMFYILKNNNIDIGVNVIEQLYLPKEKYPPYLRVITMLTVLIFIIFFTFSLTIGGNAINDLKAEKFYENYVNGHYYVSSHGNYREVTYGIWLSNLIIGRITLVMFILTFVLTGIHRVRKRNK